MNSTILTRIFGAIIAAALIFWLAETGYFGWNAFPQSEAERACDHIATVIFFSAWLVFFVPGLSFLQAINPFRRVTWLYIERDGHEIIAAYRTTSQWKALLLAGVLWLFGKTIRACGVPSRPSRFLIVHQVNESAPSEHDSDATRPF